MDILEARDIAYKVKRSTRFKDKTKIYIVGSIARDENYVKDIDLLVVTDKFDKNLLSSICFPKRCGIIIHKIIACGDRKCSLKLKFIKSNLIVKVDYFYATIDEKPYALLHYIGNKLYNIRLRNKARTLGYLLNQYGIFDRKTNKKIKYNINSESDIQRFLGVTIRPRNQRK